MSVSCDDEYAKYCTRAVEKNNNLVRKQYTQQIQELRQMEETLARKEMAQLQTKLDLAKADADNIKAENKELRAKLKAADKELSDTRAEAEKITAEAIDQANAQMENLLEQTIKLKEGERDTGNKRAAEAEAKVEAEAAKHAKVLATQTARHAEALRVAEQRGKDALEKQTKKLTQQLDADALDAALRLKKQAVEANTRFDDAAKRHAQEMQYKDNELDDVWGRQDDLRLTEEALELVQRRRGRAINLFKEYYHMFYQARKGTLRLVQDITDVYSDTVVGKQIIRPLQTFAEQYNERAIENMGFYAPDIDAIDSDILNNR